MARLSRFGFAALAIVALGCSTKSGATSAPAGPSGGDASALVDAGAFAVVDTCAPGPTPTADTVTFEADLAYGSLPAQRLDIARPRGGGRAPLVVAIHGGGWRTGDKAEFDPVIQNLAAEGFVAASLGYRLTSSPGVVFPAAVQDVRCAVRWLRANAATYGIDKTRVAALGGSAGAHLASMLGVASDATSLDGPCVARGDDRGRVGRPPGRRRPHRASAARLGGRHVHAS